MGFTLKEEYQETGGYLHIMEKDSYDFWDEGEVRQMSAYDVDRCIMLARVLDTIHRCEQTLEYRDRREKHIYIVRPSEVEPNTNITVELTPQFMRAIGHIGLSLFLDLRANGEEETASSIIHQSHYSK